MLTDITSSEEKIKEQFVHFLTVYDIYSDVIYVKPDGIVITSFIDEVIGNDLSNREWFKASKEGQVYISDIYRSPILDEPVLVMSAPVFDENEEVIAVISPAFNFKHLWETFDQFSEQEVMTSLGGYAFLINKNVRLLLILITIKY